MHVGMATFCHPRSQVPHYRSDVAQSHRNDRSAIQASGCALLSRAYACPASGLSLPKTQGSKWIQNPVSGILCWRKSGGSRATVTCRSRSSTRCLSQNQGRRQATVGGGAEWGVQQSCISPTAQVVANRVGFAEGCDPDEARNASGAPHQECLSRPCVDDGMRSKPSGDEDSKSSVLSWKRWGIFRVLARSLPLLCASILLVSLLAARPARAMEMSSIRHSLNDRAREMAVRCWPSLKAVAMVIKDQGLLLLLLLALSAFFSMAETSITTLWPWKVRELAEKEKEGGVFSVLRQDVTRFLTTILIGTTVVNIGATALVTEAATTIFGEAGVTAATGIMTVLLLLVTEIAPKSIAVHNATEVARVVVRPVAWLSVVLYPVGRACTALSMWLLKLLGLKSSGDPFVSEEELKLMLRGAEMSGAIEEEEQDMIENVLEIKDTFVREVMTPLVNVVAIDSGATLVDLKQLWVQHQYSRVPVFERRVDNIVGISYVMDLLDYCEEPHMLQHLTTGRIAHRPAYFVPDSMSVWNLLREFRIRKVHMAIVLNEYGGTVGLVTLEDVVEEIVGEIFDESDSKEEIRKKTGYMVQREAGVYDVDANTSIEDLIETFEIDLPEGPNRYETVSGYVCEAFGYIPRTGDQKEVKLKRVVEDEEEEEESKGSPMSRFKLTILAGNARKVGAVRFERIAETVEEAVVLEERVRRDKDKEAEREREEREKEREREMERAKERAQQWELAEREDRKRRESFRARGRKEREDGGLGLVWELEEEEEEGGEAREEEEDLVGHFQYRGAEKEVPGGSSEEEEEEEERSKHPRIEGAQVSPLLHPPAPVPP